MALAARTSPAREGPAWLRGQRRGHRRGRDEVATRSRRHPSPQAAEVSWIAGRTFLLRRGTQARDAGEGPGPGPGRGTQARDGGERERDTAEIGVFGGSGFYSLLDDVREVKVDTPYGPPSDSFFLADVARPPRRVPAAARPAAHDPAAPDQLPGQRLGDALARRQGGHLAVRRGLAPARRQARRLRRVRPVRRPDPRPRRHVLRRPDRDPPLVGRDLRPDPARARDRHHPRPRHRGPRDAARSSSSRGRASRPRPSRSGSATPAGRSST